MLTLNLPALTGERVVLKPAENTLYMRDLALRDPYNHFTFQEAVAAEHLFVGCWNGYVRQGDLLLKAGAIAIAHSESKGMWSFDGYKDREFVKRLDNKYSFSLEAGRLALDYILDKITPLIYATPDTQNRAVIMLDKKLGFIPVKKFKYNEREFLLMEAKCR